MKFTFDIIGDTSHFPADDDNVDVDIFLADGRCYGAAFFTLRNAAKLMESAKSNGDKSQGAYFWSTNMILVETLSEESLRHAIDRMIKSRTLFYACSKSGSRLPWLKERLENAIAEGLCSWREEEKHPELGHGAFVWHDAPELLVFEDGMLYQGKEIHFDYLRKIRRLDWRTLAKAEASPSGMVEFGLHTLGARFRFPVPLKVYHFLLTLLSDMVIVDLDEENPSKP